MTSDDEPIRQHLPASPEHYYLADELRHIRTKLDEIEDKMLSGEEVLEVREMLSNRKGMATIAATMKAAFIWLIALASAVAVLWGGFVDAVRHALLGIK